MEPSNTEFILVRYANPIYTTTKGIFKRDTQDLSKLDFIKTLNTSIGQVDEYELISD